MKNFKKLDEGFVCVNCGKEVKPLGYTSRNHCPYCLHSVHIDISPGDRANTCLGVLEPIGIETKKGDYIMVFKCKKCGEQGRNKLATDDDYNKVLEISAKGRF